MTTVISADDWPLFILCLILATLLFALDPGLSVIAIALVSILIYVFRQQLHAGYEAVIGSDTPSSDKPE
ncbi:hypothetical protein [Haladaptatus sp. DYF46]|uniref:hypothetical protein n=1 Tax=Haladaptatus sp. DYF46 TaxID=2886041 RepID=UPI001E5A6F09|nr:hypothetical protein [Haladaptatus sp. DYF46]